MDTVLRAIVQPAVVFLLFFLAAIGAAVLKRFIPEGSIKRVLYRKHLVWPENDSPEAMREFGNDWWPVLYYALGTVAVFGWMFFLAYRYRLL